MLTDFARPRATPGVCIKTICRHDTHRDIPRPTFDTELLVGAGLDTQAGATMPTGQQLGAALVAGQPPARSPTGQITPPLQARRSFQPNNGACKGCSKFDLSPHRSNEQMAVNTRM